MRKPTMPAVEADAVTEGLATSVWDAPFDAGAIVGYDEALEFVRNEQGDAE